jgi:hypothetical protein
MPCTDSTVLNIFPVPLNADSLSTSRTCHLPQRLFTISTHDSKKPLGAECLQEPHVRLVSNTVACFLFPIARQQWPTITLVERQRAKKFMARTPTPGAPKARKGQSTNPLPIPRPHRAPPVTLSLCHFVFTAGRLLAALLQVPGKTCSRSLKVKPSELLRLCGP